MGPPIVQESPAAGRDDGATSSPTSVRGAGSRSSTPSEQTRTCCSAGGLRGHHPLTTRAAGGPVHAGPAGVLPGANDPQAAVVAIDPRNGDVKALTTLRRYPRKVDATGAVREPADGYTRFGFNLATGAHRSTGSTLKPFTLATALEQGKSLNERRRAPGCDSIRNPGGEPNPYRYCNAGESSYGGSLTLRQALQKSVNTVYVPLANEVGRDNVKNLLEAAGAQASPAFPIASGNLSLRPRRRRRGHAAVDGQRVRHAGQQRLPDAPRAS
jgi:membrane peptidoglycan carboxypeptidase